VVGFCVADVLRRGGHGRHGGRWPDLEMAAGNCDCSVAGDRRPSDRDSTIKIRRYPFAGNLSKETLKFLETNPQSLAHSRKLRFHI
jgi:hypothetical protein